jgi:hypothetical protein
VFFWEIEKGSPVKVGVKTNLSHFLKNVFQNFEPFLANLALKFKKLLIPDDLKTLLSQNLTVGAKKVRNFMQIWNRWRKAKKLAQYKVMKQ